LLLAPPRVIDHSVENWLFIADEAENNVKSDVGVLVPSQDLVGRGVVRRELGGSVKMVLSLGITSQNYILPTPEGVEHTIWFQNCLQSCQKYSVNKVCLQSCLQSRGREG